ncbi:IgaA/UmoB family intracellular growth attenuator [Salmonella enterica]
MPIKFTLSWMKGAQTIEVTTVNSLKKLACEWAIRCT